MNAIFVPTRSRSQILLEKRLTLDWMICSTLPIYIVIRPEEELLYDHFLEEFIRTRAIKEGHITVLVAPPDCDTLAKTYDFIMEFCVQEKILKACIMDDDLVFAERVDFEEEKLYKLPFADGARLVDELFYYCTEESPITSTRHRRFGQTEPRPYRSNRKLIGVLCCYVPVVSLEKFYWEGGSMYDHRMVLHLLSKGYSNTQICKFTQDDGLGYFADGGCADYRTHETHSESAKLLAKMFPKGVDLRVKSIGKGAEKKQVFDVTIRPSKVFDADKFKRRFGHVFEEL